MDDAHVELRALGGGYDWSCGGMDAMVTCVARPLTRAPVRLPTCPPVFEPAVGLLGPRFTKKNRRPTPAAT